jgi:hypothetical protein
MGEKERGVALALPASLPSARKRKTGTGETPVHEHDPEKWGPVSRKIMPY